MEVLKDGTFIDYIDSASLSRGLRPSDKSPRNMRFLVSSKGAVGSDGVLSTIDDLESFRISSPLFSGTYPYPQLFSIAGVVIVCDKTSIFEYDVESGTLKSVLTGITEGSIWSAAGANKYVYLTNEKVVVIRSSSDGEYSISTDFRAAKTVCYFNGQFMLGGLL